MSGGTDEPAKLTDVGGVDAETAEALRRSGYRTVEDLRAASEDDLATVEGVSTPLAAHIAAHVGSSVTGTGARDEQTRDEASDEDVRSESESGPRTTAGETRGADRRRRDPRDRPAAAVGTASSGETLYEEVLTPRVAGGVLTLVTVHVLLFSLLISGLILLFSPASADVGVGALALPVLSFGAFGAAWGAVTYYRMRVYVKVTESDVEIVRNWNSRRGAPQVTFPFAGISRVEVGDSIRPHLGDGDTDQTYMVKPGRIPGIDLSYRRGVRIERIDDPPVYVGSDRPDDLAATIRTRMAGTEQVASTSVPSGTASETVRDTDDGAITGTVPGASKKQERRGVVAVVLFAVGMIVAIEAGGAAGIVVVLGILGVLFVVTGATAWRKERHELATFEPTTGRVLATEADERTDNRRSPLVKYEYTVEGETYENDKIWPGGPMAKQMGPRSSQDFLAQFPEGSDTTVYYDPADPSSAFLVKESTSRWFASIVAVGLGLLVYLALVFSGGVQPPTP